MGEHKASEFGKKTRTTADLNSGDGQVTGSTLIMLQGIDEERDANPYVVHTPGSGIPLRGLVVFLIVASLLLASALVYLVQSHRIAWQPWLFQRIAPRAPAGIRLSEGQQRSAIDRKIVRESQSYLSALAAGRKVGEAQVMAFGSRDVRDVAVIRVMKLKRGTRYHTAQLEVRGVVDGALRTLHVVITADVQPDESLVMSDASLGDLR